MNSKKAFARVGVKAKPKSKKPPASILASRYSETEQRKLDFVLREACEHGGLRLSQRQIVAMARSLEKLTTEDLERAMDPMTRAEYAIKREVPYWITQREVANLGPRDMQALQYRLNEAQLYHHYYDDTMQGRRVWTPLHDDWGTRDLVVEPVGTRSNDPPLSWEQLKELEEHFKKDAYKTVAFYDEDPREVQPNVRAQIQGEFPPPPLSPQGKRDLIKGLWGKLIGRTVSIPKDEEARQFLALNARLTKDENR